PVAINGHVTMAGPMMFGPALDESAIDGENECLIGEVNERLLAEYVSAQRRDPAIVVPARKSSQVNVGEFLTTRKIECKCDQRALRARGAHDDVASIPGGGALVRTELKLAICFRI